MRYLRAIYSPETDNLLSNHGQVNKRTGRLFTVNNKMEIHCEEGPYFIYI